MVAAVGQAAGTAAVVVVVAAVVVVVVVAVVVALNRLPKESFQRPARSFGVTFVRPSHVGEKPR
jgi:energy-converting hydrogenase Eha subunit A